MSEVRADFNPKPGPLPPDKSITLRIGEAGELTITPSGSESGFRYTTEVGKDGNPSFRYTTHEVGEEGEFTIFNN